MCCFSGCGIMVIKAFMGAVGGVGSACRLKYKKKLRK